MTVAKMPKVETRMSRAREAGLASVALAQNAQLLRQIAQIHLYDRGQTPHDRIVRIGERRLRVVHDRRIRVDQRLRVVGQPRYDVRRREEHEQGDARVNDGDRRTQRHARLQAAHRG